MWWFVVVCDGLSYSHSTHTPTQAVSFFFVARIRLGTILRRFSINYFSGLGLRVRVRVSVVITPGGDMVMVSLGLGSELGLGLGYGYKYVWGYGYNNNNDRNGSCLTWLATSLEEKRRWLIINASPRGQCKERHIQKKRENRASHLVG